jgi:hypothetical protein
VTEGQAGPDPARTARQNGLALAALRQYRAYLQRELATVIAYEKVLSGGPRPARTSPAGSCGTFPLLRQLIATEPGPITAEIALAWLEARGWVSRARNRVRAVSSALAHLAELGELVRDRQGVYLTPAVAADGDVTTTLKAIPGPGNQG